MKRGRRLGQTVNPRDKRGWMIPRPGTIRRKIYDLMAQGKKGKEICGILGIGEATYNTHRQNITNADRLNAQRYANARGETVKLPANFGKINRSYLAETTIAQLTQRVQDAELALKVWDAGRDSEYWSRYPSPLQAHHGNQ